MTRLFQGKTTTEGNADLDALAGGIPTGRTPTSLRQYLTNSIAYNPMDFGATGDGNADDYAATVLAAAANVPLLLAAGKTHRINTSMSIPGVHPRGGMLKPANGVTITITGAVSLVHLKWIDLSLGGTVVFAPTSYATLSPVWWGAKGDWNYDTNVGTDNAAAFQAMCAAMTGNISQGWRIVVPSGSYYLTQGFRITRSITTLEQLGVVYVFDPAADFVPGVAGTAAPSTSICTDWNGGSEIFNCRQVGGQIQSPTTNTKLKVGIRLADVSTFEMRKSSTHTTFTSNARAAASKTIGLLVQGRECIDIDGSNQFVADQPVQISRNPNARIELDTCKINPSIITCLTPSADAFLVDSGCAILNSEILRNSAVTQGRDQFRWINVAGQAITSTNVRIGPFRGEQATDTTGYAVNIVTDASQLFGLKLDGIQPNFTQHGIKLRGVVSTRLVDYRYTGGADATRLTLNLDDTCEDFIGTNVFIQAGNSLSLTNLRFAFAWGKSTDKLVPSNFTLRRNIDVDNFEMIADPAGGGGFRFSLSGGARVFELRPNNQGVGNDGWTIYDVTNSKKLLYMDTSNMIHAGQGAIVVDQSGAGVASRIYAYGADNIRYYLQPPNGGGSATWVAG